MKKYLILIFCLALSACVSAPDDFQPEKTEVQKVSAGAQDHYFRYPESALIVEESNAQVPQRLLEAGLFRSGVGVKNEQGVGGRQSDTLAIGTRSDRANSAAVAITPQCFTISNDVQFI